MYMFVYIMVGACMFMWRPEVMSVSSWIVLHLVTFNFDFARMTLNIHTHVPCWACGGHRTT